MNCAEFKDSMNSKLGGLNLTQAEQAHLEQCPDCRAYYDDLKQLESSLNEIEIAPITAVEFAAVQEKLDRRITGYLSRATGLYDFMVRYGSSLAAVIMIVFVSYVSGLGPAKVDQNAVNITDSLLENTGYTVDDTQTLDDKYFNAAVDDYSIRYGSVAGDLLLDDLTTEEYEYLKNNIDVGGIL